MNAFHEDQTPGRAPFTIQDLTPDCTSSSLRCPAGGHGNGAASRIAQEGKGQKEGKTGMSKEVFSRESGALECSLTVNDDGTLTYWESNSGWRMVRRGSETKTQTYTIEEAKAKWPSYADKIDEALAEIKSSRTD